MPFLFASLVLAVAFILVFAPAAHAGNEGGSCDPERGDCEQCHTSSFEDGYGPHGFYDGTGDKCRVCHTVHNATGSVKLLPRDTIKASCETCHDGTGGQGVYGALAARGKVPGAMHRIDTTNVIPGGNALTGLEATRTFTGVGGNLSCDDCHSPHNSKVVNAFRGERFRGGLGLVLGYTYPDAGPSSKLLRRRPSGATTDVAEYGSDWCAACHRGRVFGTGLHTHPVDSKTNTTTPFDYNHVALLSSGNLTLTTTMGAMTDGPGSKPTNRGFLMPYPRTAQQRGHYPICQQCHEDARYVGDLSEAGAQAAPFSVTATAFAGQYPLSDNPRFQNFPHEGENPRFLVEYGDDLCTNCHVTTVLP
jgi:hypothetical protein